MAIYRAKLNKDAMLRIPEKERNIFFALAHLQNEIRFSIDSVAWSKFSDHEDENEFEGQLALNFFYLRILAGKLHEGWQLLNKHLFNNKDLSIDFNNKGSKEGTECLNSIKAYFSKNNTISDIRNKLSFHYNPVELASHLEIMKDNLSLYLSSENGANTIYYFAEALANWAVISKLKNYKNLNPVKEIIEELIEVAGNFSIFIVHFMSYVIRKYEPDIWDERAEKIIIKDLKTFKSIRIPAFTDTSNGLF